MNVEQFIRESPQMKAEIGLMPVLKFDLIGKLFVLCSRLFEKRNSVLRSVDENKDSDYSNGIAVVHDIIKSVTIGE